MRHLVLLALLIALAAPLAACGKKASPVAPAGEPMVFPRVYPPEPPIPNRPPQQPE